MSVSTSGPSSSSLGIAPPSSQIQAAKPLFGVAPAARGHIDDLGGRVRVGVVADEAEVRVERLENDGSHPKPRFSSSWAGPGTSER